ncbi:MAG: hypothetical protein ABIH66_14085 [bacterium]
MIIVTAHAQDEMGKNDLDDIMKNKTLSGPGVYLEKPVTPRTYVNSIKKALNMEITEEEEKFMPVKEELNKQLSGADPEKLKKMLDILKDK